MLFLEQLGAQPYLSELPVGERMECAVATCTGETDDVKTQLPYAAIIGGITFVIYFAIGWTI